jgi:hypothetical protein
MLSPLWRLVVVISVSSTLIGCGASLQQLPETSATAERRCGSRQNSFDEGTTWACFYVRRPPPEHMAIRVVTATWRPLNVITGGQTYPQALASAFHGRLAEVQGR